MVRYKTVILVMGLLWFSSRESCLLHAIVHGRSEVRTLVGDHCPVANVPFVQQMVYVENMPEVKRVHQLRCGIF